MFQVTPALGISDAVLPQPTGVKPHHFPPEFGPSPGLAVPLRTNAPEGEARGTVGDLSVVTKHLERKDFREQAYMHCYLP